MRVGIHSGIHLNSVAIFESGLILLVKLSKSSLKYDELIITTFSSIEDTCKNSTSFSIKSANDDAMSISDKPGG